MDSLVRAIEGNVWLAWAALAVSFVVLAKCAGLFVDSSVAIAERFKIPKVIIGIVLVALATTAPELSVSMMSALAGSPEMALGNAIGSVICNSGLALALCAVVSRKPVPVQPGALKVSGGFLVMVSLIAFACVLPDLTLSRMEGLFLVFLFVSYLGFLFRQQKSGQFQQPVDLEMMETEKNWPLYKMVAVFLVGLVGVLLSSKLIVASATKIASSVGIPDSVVALTLVALGTSIPEVATSIVAARRGEGALSVGNIIGANIMNICWVAGASSVANALTLSSQEMWFMFPAMFVVVVVSLVVLATGKQLSRREGMVLFGLYVLYVASFFMVFQRD